MSTTLPAAILQTTITDDLTVTGTLSVAGTVSGAGVTALIGNRAQTYLIQNTVAPTWILLGTYTPSTNGLGDKVGIRILTSNGYNANYTQDTDGTVYFKCSNGSSVDANGFAGDSHWYSTGRGFAISAVKWVANTAGTAATSYALYVDFLPYPGQSSTYTVTLSSPGAWVNSNTSSTDPGAGSATVCVSVQDFYVAGPLSVSGATTLTGGLSVTGTVTASGGATFGNGAGYQAITIAGGAAQTRGLWFDSNASPRWLICADGTAESGSSAGSNFDILAFSDAGAYLSTPITITRSSGQVIIQSGLYVAGGPVTAVSGQVTIGSPTLASQAYEILDSAAGQFRTISYQSAGVNRWAVNANNTAESGSNAGSDFTIQAFNDAGAALSTSLTITRASGAVALAGAFSVAGTVSGAGFTSLLAPYSTTAAAIVPFASVAALRLNSAAICYACLVGYANVGDGGEGLFSYVASDMSAADNGGTIIVDASGRRWHRAGGAGTVSVRWFGAKGNGTTNDSPAFQAAINVAMAARGAVYVPAAPVYYLLNTALNVTNGQELLIHGDGCFPCTARITPTGGSVLAGNTGGVVIDATGTSGVILRDFTIGSIGLSNPSTVGIFLGNSATYTNGGSSCQLDNVSILMPATGTSVPLYGVNVNLLSLIQVNTMGDYGIYLTNANDLGLTPPFGTRGPNIQSDGCSSYGCFIGGYGTQIPFVLANANCGQHDQLYICNMNSSASYAGEPYAMRITNCSDLKIKVEIDYFPSAVVMCGAWVDVDLSGTIYSAPCPVRSGFPGIAAFEGTSIQGGQLAIRALCAATNYAYAMGGSATMVSIQHTKFIFDSTVISAVFYFNMTSANPTPLFNLKMDGNTDCPPMTLLVNGAAMTAAGYRMWINGIRNGTA